MSKSSGRQLSGIDVVGKKVLILGEAGSGKTMLASRLAIDLVTMFDTNQLTIIDMAPQALGQIGGKMTDYLSSITKMRYLSPERVYTPRLAGTSREQVLQFAELNRNSVEPLLDEFFRKPTKILIMNDVTLYLHAGSLEKILDCAHAADTTVVTAYYGSKLAEDHGSGITLREKRIVDALASRMDQVIELSPSRSQSFWRRVLEKLAIGRKTLVLLSNVRRWMARITLVFCQETPPTHINVHPCLSQPNRPDPLPPRICTLFA